MADFNIAKKITITHEGGYNRGFKGSGETYKGIDRNHSRNWPGWKIIDRIPNKQTYQVFKNPALDRLVDEFYKKSMWPLMKGDAIKNQSLANMVFDFYFHKPAILIEAANAAARELESDVETSDNKISHDVLDVLNRYPGEMFQAIQSLRLLHYNNQWLNDKYKIYYKTTRRGLIARANKFTFTPGTIAGIIF